MIPYLLIVDEVLQPDQFERFRRYAITADWNNCENFIELKDEPWVGEAISRIMGSLIEFKSVVLRYLPENSPMKYAYGDLEADSTFTARLFLNGSDKGGLSLVRHLPSGVENAHVEGWSKDEDSAQAWSPVVTVPMESNRLVISPTELLKALHPHGGFGDSPETGMLIFECHFNLIGQQRSANE